MHVHREEGIFTIRIELTAEFDESYEGDADGYAWLRAWQAEVQPRLARAVFDVLREGGRFDAVPATRGGSPDENLEIAVQLRSARPTTPKVRA
jgi:hypothetical protein